MRLAFAKLHSDHDCFLKSHTETGPWVLKMGLVSSFLVFIPCVAWSPGSVHLTVGRAVGRKVGSLRVKQNG